MCIENFNLYCRAKLGTNVLQDPSKGCEFYPSMRFARWVFHEIQPKNSDPLLFSLGKRCVFCFAALPFGLLCLIEAVSKCAFAILAVLAEPFGIQLSRNLALSVLYSVGSGVGIVLDLVPRYAFKRTSLTIVD